MTTYPNSTTGPEAGSNAGRGFRYQDLVGALFVTRMYLGDAGFDAIVPEGSDDYEIRSADGVILVDTKSNRAHARLRSESDDAASLQKLWARPLTAGAQLSEYWLVTERNRSGGFVTAKWPAKELFSGQSSTNSKLSFVLIEPDPLRTATELLTAQRRITPLAAELIVIAFAREVGDVASANGPINLEQRKAITPSDADRIAARVLTAVDADRLEALLRSGFVSVVDFLTPLEDAGFYLGVDVQPGHFAAGLALDRPDEAARVVEALARNGAVVIKGPSGAGKSSLMWNAVLASRDARRWFRVNTSVAAEPGALTAFLHAYGNVAIGFVVDDIGRGGVEAWSALRLHSAPHTQAVMIGSIRSEDAALLPARHTIAEVETGADSQLARALWMRLRERGQTRWPGWNEPWSQSQGLLLEYGHILTAGARLDTVILDQVRTRLEQKRDHELAILGASALAASHSGSVAIATLRRELNLSAGDMARALERLIAEHLVRVDASGAKLSGLHSMRATSICSALVEVSYSPLTEQATWAIAVTDVASLEKVITGLVASCAISDEAAAEAAAARLAGKIVLSEGAAAVRGLRAGILTLTARDWLSTLSAAGIPRKLVTLSATMGWIDPFSTPDFGELQKLIVYGNRLRTSVAVQRFPASLASALVVGLRESADRAVVADVVDALSALARAPLTIEERVALSTLPLAFDDLAIADVVRILDAAESIEPEIALTLVRRSGHTDLLKRLSEETPFALPITQAVVGDDFVVQGDIYEAAVRPGESPNDRLVAYVECIMRLEPRATHAHVRLVDLYGAKSLHLDSEKRIARKHAPPKVIAQSNRRVLDVVAVEIATESWSHYLALGEKLLKCGLRALQRLLDSVSVGRINMQALAALNETITACDNLIAPADPPRIGTQKAAVLSSRQLTPLQNVVFSSNSQLVSRVVQLPEGAAALAGYVQDLIKQVDDAKQEPWLLVRDCAPEELDQLQDTLRKIELVALEAAASGANPQQRWKKADSKPKGAFDLVAHRSGKAFLQRIEARRVALSELVVRELPGVVLGGPTLADGIMWQTHFIATFPLETFSDFERWVTEARWIGERLRMQVEEGEDIVLIPVLNGCFAVDYSYQLSRGKQDSIVAPILIAAGRASLLAAPDHSAISRLGSPVITTPVEIGRVSSALLDLAGMHQLGLGGPQRPAAERERFELAISNLATDGPRVLEMFRGVDQPAVDALRTLVELLVGGESEATDFSVPSDSMQNALVELTWRLSLVPR